MNIDILTSPLIIILRIMYISYKILYKLCHNCPNFFIEFLHRHIYLGFPILKSILLSVQDEYCGK